MTISQIITGSGRNLMLHRVFTAAPTITAVTKFRIGTGQTAATRNDTALQYGLSGWNGGDDDKDFVSGYPSFDTVTQNVTLRGFVASTQGTGKSLAEVGEFNEDGWMFSRDTFTAMSKTDQQEISLIWVHEVEEE